MATGRASPSKLVFILLDGLSFGNLSNTVCSDTKIGHFGIRVLITYFSVKFPCIQKKPNSPSNGF